MVLRAVRLESPGWWEFLGAAVSVEMLLRYLQYRVHRRKDRQWREAQERERGELENEMLRVKIIREKVELAKEMGLTDDDFAPLQNELLHRPLRRLDAFQDNGTIGGAEPLQIPDQRQDGPPPESPRG
jgi:hypothetical protein